MKAQFLEFGFTKLDQLISKNEVAYLSTIYDSILNNQQQTKGLRSDLSGNNDGNEVEKITQIMKPSLVAPELLNSEAYLRASQFAKDYLGDDMELDFDMLINKAPNTNTKTPWHQDAAYWINLPDKRAISCWIAIDEALEENGCMWFIPRNKDQVIVMHQALPNKGALFCKVNDTNAVCVPLKPGGCTFHDGFTFHFSKGNATSNHRRALILNFRPKAMIDLERSQGVDHTGDREVRNKK